MGGCRGGSERGGGLPEGPAHVRREEAVDERICRRVERRQALDERRDGHVRLRPRHVPVHLQQVEYYERAPAQDENCNGRGIHVTFRAPQRRPLTENDDEGHLNRFDLGLRDDAPRARPPRVVILAMPQGALLRTYANK